MTDRCGDDLIGARKFMTVCQTHMREVFSGGQLPMEDVIMRLGEIQDHAKLMHARAIYKSAQFVIDQLTGHASLSDCASSVLVLQKHIRQYECGLSEIAPINAAANSPQMTPTGPPIVSNIARQKTAINVLEPLIALAPTEDQPALTRLVSIAANDQPKAAAPLSKSQFDKLDSIFPGLTNHLLRQARVQGKSVSVSVASDEVFLDGDQLNILSEKLIELGDALITETVESTEIRSSQGLSQSAHIAITARQSHQKLSILVSCDGTALSTPSISRLTKGVKGDMRFAISSKGRLNQVELQNIICSTIDRNPVRREAAS
ncbi:MAG: hypothetical protein HKN36_13330 [Hellea sp.]|nr:hypothetical protein [Hellea sp.]